jgi:hypothetical protein
MVTGDEWWRLLPPGTSGDALRVLAARGVRAFAAGFVALLPPIYLVELWHQMTPDHARIVAGTGGSVGI